MKKPLSQREKRLMPILPAGLILLLYALVGPGQGDLSDLKDRIEREVGRQVEPGAIERTRAEVRQYQRQKREWEADDQARRTEAGAGNPVWLDNPEAQAAAAAFQAAVQREGLLLLEERRAEPEDQRRLIGSQARTDSAELWKLHLVGDFTQMQNLIRHFNGPVHPPLPFAVEMDQHSGNANPIRHWKLWVWK